MISTGTTSYTHIVCGRCSKVLYCSKVDDAGWRPGCGYGWCHHAEDGPMVVFDAPPTADCWHQCEEAA